MNEDKGTVVQPDEAQGRASVAESDQVDVAGLAAQLAAITSQRDRLDSEKAELHDLLLRRQADYDNFRKRAEREKSEVRDFAAMEAVRTLLPILDDFDRAVKAAPGDGAVREYARGMSLIWQRLVDSLTKLGLEPIESVGQSFDPNVHNAILREDRDDVDDQTVIEEFQKGYNFKGRLLRPAMVKVAVKP